jgi:hypothetical protein
MLGTGDLLRSGSCEHPSACGGDASEGRVSNGVEALVDHGYPQCKLHGSEARPEAE